MRDGRLDGVEHSLRLARVALGVPAWAGWIGTAPELEHRVAGEHDAVVVCEQLHGFHKGGKVGAAGLGSEAKQRRAVSASAALLSAAASAASALLPAAASAALVPAASLVAAGATLQPAAHLPAALLRAGPVLATAVLRAAILLTRAATILPAATVPRRAAVLGTERLERGFGSCALGHDLHPEVDVVVVRLGRRHRVFERGRWRPRVAQKGDDSQIVLFEHLSA